MSTRTPVLKWLLASLMMVVFAGPGCGLIYKQNIQQGNALEAEDLDQLYIGMNKRQVLFVLGSPSIHDPFEAERWDYVQTFSRRGEPAVQRTVTLRFKDDLLAEMIGVDQTPTALVDEVPAAAAAPPGATPAPADSSMLDADAGSRQAEEEAQEALKPEAEVQGIGTPSSQERELEDQVEAVLSGEEQEPE
jgi:outer membrane protein assembly factor BamE